MADWISIRSPQLLHIDDRGLCYGADQEWYSTSWQRSAGCGPTACSHLLWYLSRTRPGCEALCHHDGAGRAGFVGLMEDVWKHVTPGSMGVNSASIFVDGALGYSADRGIALRPRVLQIPTFPGRRPNIAQVVEFLCGAFAEDLPVAFLNLSNGSLKSLDGWHWVTLVAVCPESQTAVMYDQRKRTEIALGLWLRTTVLGGAFVALEPAT